MELTFAVIGPGSVGSVLIRSLRAEGFEVVSVLRHGDDLRSLSDRASVVAITTPDDAIADVAEELAAAETGWTARIVLHVSGVHTSDILGPLKELGASTASFHPLSSYPPSAESDPGRSLEGTTIVLEGDQTAVETLTGVADRLGARAVRISARQKPAYHVAASVASNYLVTVAAGVQAILESASIDPHLMDGLISDTLSNLVTQPASSALTGPIVRGDVDTVRLHLETLRETAPGWSPFYRALGLATVRVASESGRLGSADRQALLDILTSDAG